MVQVIGSKHCARCSAVKNILKNKGVDFDYQLHEEMNDDTIIEKAREEGFMSFPMIIKDGQFTDLQSV